MRRVTDDMVQSWLTWARNFGEIEHFERVADKGAKWLVVLPSGIKKTRYDISSSFLDRDSYVPTELVLSSREALIFALGCATGGAKERARWTQADWDRWAEDRRRSRSDLADFEGEAEDIMPELTPPA